MSKHEWSNINPSEVGKTLLWLANLWYAQVNVTRHGPDVPLLLIHGMVFISVMPAWVRSNVAGALPSVQALANAIARAAPPEPPALPPQTGDPPDDDQSQQAA